MSELKTIEIKAFVPARNFERSLQFYADLGFSVEVLSDDMAYLWVDTSSFLLQRFYVREHAENFMMHLLVPDVEVWWRHVVAQDLGAKYGVRVLPPEDRPWGIRDFCVDDPTGVLWRIGQVIEETPA
jgi:catechol 2,3-dioxygenase-like lactoylglutathione lyase family enzyme